jgi:hypothetical protein
MPLLPSPLPTPNSSIWNLILAAVGVLAFGATLTTDFPFSFEFKGWGYEPQTLNFTKH